MLTGPEDLAALTLLGRVKNEPSKKLEIFPNRHPGRRYVVELRTEEFTSLCPATGQPDFGTITIRYIPGPSIIESKSLKLYLWSFRNEGCFQEHLVNVMLDDLVSALDPVWLEVTGEFRPRGGIGITVHAEHGRRDE
ncbi:NADPH-dependent 7-cyano-7-deazaguanine reductase QueF [Opitutaceae bacterium TAV4]|nr:NADPH-dependent 7-cyano-7-deazaguanine reductase QueF [Opitutaceae bacterium TAV4]RRJ99336.1 NADPH-dependent 7-cyano-7-deazaguanine reductase QueF [Opitutaceae bacterium TAV3]